MSNLELAKQFLNQCDLYSLHDRAFGDTEYEWFKDSVSVAVGHKGNSEVSVTLIITNLSFKDLEARELFRCYKTIHAELNE